MLLLFASFLLHNGPVESSELLKRKIDLMRFFYKKPGSNLELKVSYFLAT